jgi:hypothetical protein
MAIQPADGTPTTLPQGAPEPGLSGLSRRQARRSNQAAAYQKYFAPSDTMWSAGLPGPPTERQMARRYRSGIHGVLTEGANQLKRNRDLYGYGTAEDEAKKWALSQLQTAQTTGEPGVPLHMDTSPGIATLSKYATERLGSGLTPEEAAALRGPQIEAVESQAGLARRQAADATVASGYGNPGLGQVAAGRIENEREQARAGVERNMVDKELQRKGEIETLMGNANTAQEGQRQFNVGAQQSRLANLETLLQNLGQQGENRREYDVGFSQARHEAKLSRELLKRALRRAEPSGLEQASAILGGIRGGI